MMYFMVFLSLALVAVANAGCATGWAEYNNHCWKVFTDETYQSKAEAACHDSGAQLASVHSEDENKYVESLMDAAAPSKTNVFWLGLKLTRKSNTDKVISAHWNDGSEMSYGDVKILNAGQHPWGKYKGHDPEPNNFEGANEACVVFRQSKNNADIIIEPTPAAGESDLAQRHLYSRQAEKHWAFSPPFSPHLSFHFLSPLPLSVAPFSIPGSGGD